MANTVGVLITTDRQYRSGGAGPIMRSWTQMPRIMSLGAEVGMEAAGE